jgi:hypothetical protein
MPILKDYFSRKARKSANILAYKNFSQVPVLLAYASFAGRKMTLAARICILVKKLIIRGAQRFDQIKPS